MAHQTVRVAINGYGVIGKRIADAVMLQDDIELVGVAEPSRPPPRLGIGPCDKPAHGRRKA